MRRSALLAIAIFFPGLPAGFLAADTVQITGGHVAGKVERQPDFVIVEVDDEIQVAIRGARVRSVVTSDQLRPYRDRAQQAGNDAERHYQLAIWCATGDNVPGKSQHYKRFHMQRAVQLDPEHVHARASLGFKKHEGAWILTSQLMRDRGMVLSGGHWEPVEAVALEGARDTTNVEVKRWIKEISRLTGVVLRNSAKSPESFETLKGIKDPRAASAIARQLKQSRQKGTQSRALRLLWVKLLGSFKNSESVKALVAAGIDEKDEVVREAALDQLVHYGGSSASATYLQMLKSNDNKLVNRAARALTWFPDPELALTYIEALVTTHKKVISAGGPGMSAGFTNDGGGGLSTGSKPIEQIDQLPNPAVLTLVKTVEPDADYGYDEEAWQQHFARKRTAFSGDLRRDL